jgi:TonB family protein
MIKGTASAIILLLAALGATPPAIAADPQPARPLQDLYRFFTADDYPLAAIRRYAEGTVGFRLTIDAQGVVSGCVVERSSGDMDLDRATCEILRSRPHYYPARDAAGRAVEGSDTGRVTWRLPPEQSPPAALALTTADLEGMIRMNGPQLACRTTVNGRADGPTVLQMCQLLVSADGSNVLRRTVPGTEFSAVLSIRLDDAGAVPAAGDALLFRAASAMTVRPDGSVSSCAPMGEAARPPEGFVHLPDPCALFPVGTRFYFAAEPARTQPRSVRLYLGYYLRPRQQLRLADSVPAQRARANLNSYFSTDDYPETAARRGIEGTVGFRLEINAEGRVTNCTVTDSSGDAALDSTTCAILLSRAEYRPARDAQGRAVDSTDRGRVTWRLPESEPEPFASMRAPVRIDLTFGADAEGRPVCSVLLNGGPSGKDGETLCDFVTGPGASSFIDGAPRDARATVTMTVGLDGQMPPPVSLDLGELVMDTTAYLTIGADGRITDCREGETNIHGSLSPAPVMPGTCSFPGVRALLFPVVPDGSPPRTGILHMELHMRMGGPRNT